MIKQANLFEIAPECARKADYDLDGMTPIERCAFLLGRVEIVDDTPEPRPTQQKNMTFRPGMYFRTKNDKVFKIYSMGKDGVYFDRIKHKKRINGADTSHHVTKTYKTFYVMDKINDKKAYIPFTEYDVIECHETLIECLYQGDRIMDSSYQILTVAHRINSKKKGIFLSYKNGNNDTLLLRNEDILKPINQSWIDPKGLEHGQKIKCKYTGWITIDEIWGYKIKAKEKNKDGFPRWVNVWEIVDTKCPSDNI